MRWIFLHFVRVEERGENCYDVPLGETLIEKVCRVLFAVLLQPSPFSRFV